MDDITAIKNYILYLREHAGLSVTLHPLTCEGAIIPGVLRAFNIHDNPYCIYIKTAPDAYRHCIERQGKVMARASDGSYCGTCYAGVTEFVYPIRCRESTIGFISVGGYACDAPAGYLERVAERYDLPEESLWEGYRSLKPLPKKEFADTLLYPLVLMLELLYEKNELKVSQDSLIDRILLYLQSHHTEEIRSQDLCERFYCSRSHFAHLFKSRTGMSLPAYLNSLRIEDAKVLLTHSAIDISEIAFAVGIADRNWFSTLFRRVVGMSPRAYRTATRGK